MNIKLLILFIPLSVWVSCKKETQSLNSNNNSTTQASIVGTWTWTDTYTPDGSGNYTVHWTGPQQPTGKQIIYSSSGTYSSTWNFPQMGIPFQGSNPDNGNYTNSDSLIMTSSVTGLYVRAKIYKLTSNELWFRYNGNDNYEIHCVK